MQTQIYAIRNSNFLLNVLAQDDPVLRTRCINALEDMRRDLASLQETHEIRRKGE